MTLISEERSRELQEKRDAEIGAAWSDFEIRRAVQTLHRLGVDRSLAFGLMTYCKKESLEAEKVADLESMDQSRSEQ